MDPPYNRSATTYYKAKSGIGKAILLKEKLSTAPRRVGIIGLGAGTIATYGNKGDVYRFYDINPAVVKIANSEFTYLKDTEATIEIALGDARLNLEREPSQQFDVLAIDAFSSDSIPVHLITLEALEIYEKHMKPDGVIAFHVSNRFLDLKPVVQMIAEKRGLNVAWVRDTYEDGSTSSDWILLCKDNTFLLKPDIVEATYIIPPEPGWRGWTDDFMHLLRLAYYSRKLIHDIVAQETVTFDFRRNGKLVIFSDADSFDGAQRTLTFQREHGSKQEALRQQEVLEKEPALAYIGKRIVGGIYTPSEDAGDCHDFCVTMEALLRERGVVFMTDTKVLGMERDAQCEIRAVRTAKGDIEADAYVLALGAANAWHAKQLGFYLPIYPLKGYSLTSNTATAANPAALPRISVSDSKYKVVYALLGDELRIAGMADIAGHDRSL